MSRSRRSPPVPPRRSIFIGVEGESDVAFVRFLGKWCKRQGLHLSLDIKPADGGDSVVIVQTAVSHLSSRAVKKESRDAKEGYHKKLVLLDEDRIEEDMRRKRDAMAVARENDLEVVFLSPNLEGLLFRLHRGKEKTRGIQASEVRTKLLKVWPSYKKPPDVYQLAKKFDLDDLLRAAKYDGELRKLLAFLGLWEPKSQV